MSDKSPKTILPPDENRGGIFGTLEQLARTTDHPAEELALGDVVGITPEKEIIVQDAARDVEGIEHGRAGIHGNRYTLARKARGDRSRLPDAYEGTELANDHSDYARTVEGARKYEADKARNR